MTICHQLSLYDISEEWIDELPSFGVRIYRRHYCPESCDRYFQVLLQEVQWSQGSYWDREKRVEFKYRRLTSCQGFQDRSLSGTEKIAKPFHPLVEGLIQELRELTEIPLSFVVLQQYRDGNDHVGWHRDKEYSLDTSFPVVSLSLGSPRKFGLEDLYGKKHYFVLEKGDITVFNASQQLHCVPALKRRCGSRISLTFRVQRFSQSTGS